MGNARHLCALAGGLALIGMAAAARAEGLPPLDLRDGFESGTLDKGPLQPCYRPENVEVDQQSVVRLGRWAAEMTVFPPPLTGPEAARPSDTCIDPADPSAPFEDDGTERAELWERKEVRLPFGTEVWYGFSMFVGETVPAENSGRLVIGQWKQGGGKSPFVAQRFTDRNFSVTLQQDAADGNECRILLVYQNEPPPQAESVNSATGQPCMQDISIERFGHLPNPFGTWTDMVYRIKASPEGNGVVEVWAGGKLYGRATGRIGYRTEPTTQYFKFGPYRDQESFSTTTYLDAFARGGDYRTVAMGGGDRRVIIGSSK
ncbi:heparin lyase I family protein [Azospirillum sp. ST 5-10]|uniref:heparin lyase I family protein n=1 Tax=unclassified Azospirillum TaxID=2630922 RepID=UPI003F4A0937